MKRPLTSILCAVAVGFAATNLTGCGSGPTTLSSADSSTPASSTPGDGSIPRGDPGETRAIGNEAGDVIGTYSQSELEARNRRVDEQMVLSPILGGKQGSQPDEVKARMIDALQTLDPIEVHDGKGQLVAYIGDQLIMIDDYPAAVQAAEATVEELRTDE